jgi:hypothetical protein
LEGVVPPRHKVVVRRDPHAASADRDVGELLGLSFQRVAQIAKASSLRAS